MSNMVSISIKTSVHCIKFLKIWYKKMEVSSNKKDDYSVRQGVTNKPIATNQAFSVQVFHALLRSFDHFMKAVVHVKAGVFDWSEAPSHNSRFLANTKKDLQEKIAAETGLQWDIPDKTGKGGTTTTGNIARSLLYSARDIVISDVPENHQDIFRYFGQHLSVIIKVMSSKEKVNVELYKQFCTDLYIHLLVSCKRVVYTNLPGPWISITPTIHKLLAHSWELIALNDGVGLGALDE